MSDVNIATKRTAVNVLVIGWAVTLINAILGKKIMLDAEAMGLLSPVVAAVLALGYRVSRWATSKWPTLGWVLFGSGKEPTAMKKIGE